MKIFTAAILLSVILSTPVHAIDLGNPYINKNLDSHLKEFLAFEMLSDFHKAIDKYNLERKNSPEIKEIKDHYEINDGDNKVVFDINFVIKGKFYYNGQATNLKEQKKSQSLKTVYMNFFIGEAEAAAPAALSNVLIAALLSVDEGFQTFSFLRTAQNTEKVIPLNWEKIKARIEKYQASCNEIKDRVDAKKELSQIEKLLLVMDKQKGNEADIMKDALSYVSADCSDQFSKQKASIGGRARAAEEAEELKPESLQVCAQLNNLKTCILQIPPYHMATSTKGRGYLKEKTDTSDNLQKYESSGTEK